MNSKVEMYEAEEGAEIYIGSDMPDIVDLVTANLMSVRPVRLVGYGEAARLCYTRGRIVVVGKSPTKLMNLAAFRFLAYPAWVRAHYIRYIGKSQNFPYVFNGINQTFVNLKCRCHAGKNQGAVGYFALDCLSKLTPAANGQTHIQLTNRISEIVPMSVQSVLVRRNDAYAFVAQLQKASVKP